MRIPVLYCEMIYVKVFLNPYFLCRFSVLCCRFLCTLVAEISDFYIAVNITCFTILLSNYRGMKGRSKCHSLHPRQKEHGMANAGLLRAWSHVQNYLRNLLKKQVSYFTEIHFHASFSYFPRKTF
jgi:hypothetical protein